MRICLLLIIFIILYIPARAQTLDSVNYQELHKKVEHASQMAINYLKTSQKQESDSPRYFKGEWGSIMEMNFWFPILGGYQRAYDSNCFAVAGTYNILAQLYLEHPEYEEIPEMLNLAFPRIMAYESDGSFNFWNALPPTHKMRVIFEPDNPLVRRPNNFKLSLNFISKAANVPNDNDDTAAGYMALYYHNKIFKSSIPDSLTQFGQMVTSYRDLDRRNRHWYNVFRSHGHDTGAYLTWLADEHEYLGNWNLLKDYIHAQLFYLPISKMYPHAYKPYIPYGTNDLDPIVNTNMLSAFELLDIENPQGFNDALAFIEKCVAREDYDFAATYYPNRYHMPYYISKSWQLGVKELEHVKQPIVDFLLENQHENGSWSSRDLINDHDTLQSTIYALNTYLHFDMLDNERVRTSAFKALEYILSHKIKTLNGYYWKGGVFFAGGTVVRHILHWKSDAFTTALTLEALLGMKGYLEEEDSLKHFSEAQLIE